MFALTYANAGGVLDDLFGKTAAPQEIPTAQTPSAKEVTPQPATTTPAAATQTQGFNIDNGVLRSYSGSAAVTIPAGVVRIKNRAFAGNRTITSVTIPASVTSIDDYAVFEGCTSLTTVTFASGSRLKGIGRNAFAGCTGLTSITIPASVTYIDWDAFNGCTSLTSITIPAGVKSIGRGAFLRCTRLATITFANGSQLESIGNNAFGGCIRLADITLPASIKTVEGELFSGWTAAQTINVPFARGQKPNGWPGNWTGNWTASNARIVYQGGVSETAKDRAAAQAAAQVYTPGLVFTLVGNGYSVSRGTVRSGDVVIPAVYNGMPVMAIGPYGFRQTAITGITIPSSVTSIGDGAFGNSTSITRLVIPASVKSVGKNVFFGWNSRQTINVPSESVGSWDIEWRGRPFSSEVEFTGLGS